MQTPYQKYMARKRRKQQLIKRGFLTGTITLTVTLLLLIIANIFFSSTDSNNNQSPGTITTGSNPSNDDQTSNTSDEAEENDSLNQDSTPVDKSNKLIALTYDDGPSSYTSHLLDALEKSHAKATFFVIGNRIEQYRDTIKRMDSLGMEIGSHTYGHDTLTELDATGIKETMNKTDEALFNILDHDTKLMRPVGGNINELVQTIINKPIIRWNVDTEDWKSQDVQAIVNHVLENVQDGCIILMHDIYPTTIEASEILIPKLQELGYQLVTVQELADARGITLEAGEIYRSFPNTDEIQ